MVAMKHMKPQTERTSEKKNNTLISAMELESATLWILMQQSHVLYVRQGKSSKNILLYGSSIALCANSCHFIG